ncbi:MAG: DUF3014 domain-containing protein [Nitrosomonadales bacterium]|nr:DUF3014 domain-containing protein [Nitrosomonadales bacterium]
MKKTTLFAAIAAIFCSGIAAYFYCQYSQPKPEPAAVQPLPPTMPLIKREERRVVEPVQPPPLPSLAESDNFMLDILSGLVGNKSLMKLFRPERVIHNIVATIDNLPRRLAPMTVMPLKRAPGQFIVAGAENSLTISPKNAARYTPYIKIAEALDSKKIVEIYINLYPLFQQAYEDLGYPKKYFNDRLIEVIDNLLDAPAINEPIQLVQPHVLYLFADSGLEERSVGQRILMRSGSRNEASIKAKLHEIKQELMLHMHEKKAGSTR